MYIKEILFNVTVKGKLSDNINEHIAYHSFLK